MLCPTRFKQYSLKNSKILPRCEFTFAHTANIGNSSSPAEGIKGLMGSALQSSEKGGPFSSLSVSLAAEVVPFFGKGVESTKVLLFVLESALLKASCHMREPLRPCQGTGP